MFETYVDVRTARKEFLEIFDDVEEDEKHKILRVFIKNVVRNYKTTKEEVYESIQNLVEKDYYNVHRNFNIKQTYETVKLAVNTHGDDSFTKILSCFIEVRDSLINAVDRGYLIQAESLGKALGIYLALFEYGLPFLVVESKRLNDYMNVNFKISETLSLMGKKVKHRFIKRRVMKIAKKYAPYLSNKEKHKFLDLVSHFY